MNKTLPYRFSSPALIGIVLPMLGCISTLALGQVQLPAVGPRPSGFYEGVSCGYLKVFSATEEHQWGEGSYYYPHTSYRITDANGKTIKRVENHQTDIDESPETVELAPGTYTVIAQSENDGLVRVPVVIKRARTTALHLEKGRESDHEAVSTSQAVRTPSGQIVGWMAKE
jgi:hypothetical protein